MKSQKEILKVLDILQKTHNPTMLEQFHNRSPFQLLIMTLLSARTKDATVIPIALDLFEKYPTPKELAKINQSELEKRIFKIGFFRTKAKHVIKLSQILLDTYRGKVPKTIEELISLPGVGRKTANCVLAYAFDIPAIAVDIHVYRITNKGRLHWVETNTPTETEKELCTIIPKNRWTKVNQLIVDHGQRICAPIKPKCNECSIVELCEYVKG
jgi:endonuclease III